MSSSDCDVADIALWLERLKAGDDRAAEVIWNEYFGRLVQLTQRKMVSMRRRVANEEDVALSALKSFILGAQQGKYPKLDDKLDLWKLLVVITVRKIVGHQRRDYAQKRGGGQQRGESVFLAAGDGGDAVRGIENVLGDATSPALATEFAETMDGLMDQLGDEVLKLIVSCKLEGYTNREIADQLGCTERTVERKLEKIRENWRAAVS